MAGGLDILASVNVTRVGRIIENDLRNEPQPLMWYNRASKPQVADGEITMRQAFRVYAADIVTEDSRAMLRDSGEAEFETTQIAKLKHGFGISASQAEMLMRIEDNMASSTQEWTFKGYIARNVKNLILGIQQREEAMLIGMLLDGYSYKRLGVVVGGTWSMPSDLKIVPDNDYDDVADATPLTDFINLKTFANMKYAQVFNRATMSTKMLQYIVATNQFKAMYKALNFQWNVDNTIIDVRSADPLMMKNVVGQMVGMTVEVYDGMYREHKNDGSYDTGTRFLPENMILFTNSADDNGSAWDFAQGIVMESVFARMGGTSVIGGSIVEGYGPTSYATQADPSLNPAGMVVWAVDRGAPRKLNPTCSAYIVGYDV